MKDLEVNIQKLEDRNRLLLRHKYLALSALFEAIAALEEAIEYEPTLSVIPKVKRVLDSRSKIEELLAIEKPIKHIWCHACKIKWVPKEGPTGQCPFCASESVEVVRG